MNIHPPRRRLLVAVAATGLLALLAPVLPSAVASAADRSEPPGSSADVKRADVKRADVKRADARRTVLRYRQAPLPRRAKPGASLVRASDGSTASVVDAVAAAPVSDIVVTYGPGFPVEAQTAFERAVAVWEGIVASDVPIRVTADWDSTLPPGVLGGAGPTQVYRGTGIGDGRSFYPAALAEALAGRDIGASFPDFPDVDDIQAAFSSTVAWHFGADAPPATGMDFQTVVLHELGHGLGFTGSMGFETFDGANGNGGYYGYDATTETPNRAFCCDQNLTNDVPFVFDTFAESSIGRRLVSYPNLSTVGAFTTYGSPALGAVLQSYAGWSGPAGRAAFGGESPPLYTPSVFSDGSSFAHLDEKTFPIGDPNSAMTPFLSRSERIEGPGAIALGILKDSGWRIATTDPVTQRAALPFTPLSPTRILDTRSGLAANGGLDRPVGAGDAQVRTLQVAGRGGVPTAARAVVLNVTAVQPTDSSFVSVYPLADGRPPVSNLNTRARENVANLVTVQLDRLGRVGLYNAAGSVDLLADVAGYYAEASTNGYAALTPRRVLNTSGNPLAAGAQRSLQVRGANGVPVNATAVVLNVTAARPQGGGFLTVYPQGGTRAGSTVNVVRGVTTPNLATVALGTTGGVSVYNGTAGPTDVLFDLAGYYSPTAPGRFVPLPPRRVADTRQTGGKVASGLVAGGTTRVADLRALGLPTSATAVVANVTAVAPTAGGWVTVHPMPTNPGVSNLNLRAGVTVPNLVAVKLGEGTSAEKVGLYNRSGKVHVLMDLAGYFR